MGRVREGAAPDVDQSTETVYPHPVNFLLSDPANLRLNSASPIAGEANAGNGTANAASVAINSGACVRIAASMSAYP